MRYPTTKEGFPPCDYARPTRLLPTKLEQLLTMTECRPHPILHVEVIRLHIRIATHGGLAPSGECLQLHSRLPWIPWRPLLEKVHDRRLWFLQGSRPPTHKCIGHLLPNGGITLPPHLVIAIPPLCVNRAFHRPSK